MSEKPEKLATRKSQIQFKDNNDLFEKSIRYSLSNHSLAKNEHKTHQLFCFLVGNLKYAGKAQ